MNVSTFFYLFVLKDHRKDIFRVTWPVTGKCAYPYSCFWGIKKKIICKSRFSKLKTNLAFLIEVISYNQVKMLHRNYEPHVKYWTRKKLTYSRSQISQICSLCFTAIMYLIWALNIV